jgi:molybdopterin-binding protein
VLHRIGWRQFNPAWENCNEDQRAQSLQGKVVDVKKGATTAHVRIDLGNGLIVTSSITNEAVDELELAVGSDAYAVIKASDVMVAID